jgi:hypothetical protein
MVSLIFTHGFCLGCKLLEVIKSASTFMHISEVDNSVGISFQYISQQETSGELADVT